MINNKLRLKNRFVMAPLYTSWLLGSREYEAFFLKRALGGIGMLMLPVPTYGGFEDLGKPEFFENSRRFLKLARETGCKVIPQIFSGIGEEVNKITREDLLAIPERYAVAACNAKIAGYDGFEIHGAHHSLFMHLLSPKLNNRIDEFGVSFENRTRLQLRTVKKIREKVGDDFTLFIRFCASDFVENSVDTTTTIPYAKALVDAGIDCIDISAGGTPISPPYSMSPFETKEKGCFADLAAAIKNNIPVPVIVAGKISDRECAEEILTKGKADLVAVCRQLIADPEWVNKLQERKDSSIIQCCYSNKGCFFDSIDKGMSIRCLMNEQVGFEHIGV